MVRASPEHGGSSSPRRLSLSFLMSFSSLVDLLAQKARRVSSKLRKVKPIKSNRDYGNRTPPRPHRSPRSPLTSRPKELITSMSNKAITFIHKKRFGEEKDVVFSGSQEEFGDGGVWQREILMGDKCQPLDFSGVIYYDSSGKKLDEVPPRSPRFSPLPGYLARKQEI